MLFVLLILCTLSILVYRNTEQARQFLVSDSPLSLHAYILHCNDMIWPLFNHLESAVREGTNQHERAFGKKPENVFQVDDFVVDYTVHYNNDNSNKNQTIVCIRVH